MYPPAKLSDLISVLDISEDVFIPYFDRKTGAVVTVEEWLISAVEDGDEVDTDALMDWQKDGYQLAREIVNDDGSRFITPPDQSEFNGYEVMEEFIRSLDDENTADRLWNAIEGRGAFRRFKDAVHRLGIQQSWYDYLQQAQKEFMIEWAEENNVPFEDDLQS